MSSHQDFETMIEILGIALARQEAEEQFFRRSADSSSDEMAKALFLEIADNLGKYCRDLEERKSKIEQVLQDLIAAEEAKRI